MDAVEARSVAAAVQNITGLQGCQLWSHSSDLVEVALSKEQSSMVGRGCVGPPVDLGGVALTAEQQARCGRGFDERQLRMLKAEASLPAVQLQTASWFLCFELQLFCCAPMYSAFHRIPDSSDVLPAL